MRRIWLVVILIGFVFTAAAQAGVDSYRQYLVKDTVPAMRIRNEPRFFANIHGGYSMALGSTFKFYPDDISSIALKMADNTVLSKDVSYSAPKKGLGEGFRIGGGISYVLNDYINIGLDFDYFRSTIRKTRDSSFSQSRSTGQVSMAAYQERNVISYDATLVTFSPHIMLKAISRPRWFLYNKIGAVLTFRPNSIEHDTHQSTSTQTWQGFTRDSASFTDTRYEWKIRNPSIGFSGALGAQIKLTEKIRVFGEVQFSHIVFVVSRRLTTSYLVNGLEQVNNLTLSEREIDFEKNFKTDTWVADPNLPDKAVTQRIPITYVGFQAGLVYRF